MYRMLSTRIRQMEPASLKLRFFAYSEAPAKLSEQCIPSAPKFLMAQTNPPLRSLHGER